MWAANLRQVYRDNPENKPFMCWVLFVRHGSDNQKEIIIKTKHEEMSILLAEQHVNYTELTTRTGKQEAYKKFGCRRAKHPLFLVLSKHPLDYAKGDRLLVIEWCKWRDTEVMSDDMMAFVNSFSDEEFREAVAHAQDASVWQAVGNFLEKHAASIVNVGATIVTALA